jgi:hypothetical protein
MRALVPFLLVALPAVAAGAKAPPATPATPAVERVLGVGDARYGDDDGADDGDEDGDEDGADDAWRFPCDGTDEALLREIDEAFRTRIGYGETWDESICNRGMLLVGGGTTAAARRRPPAAPATPVGGPTGAATNVTTTNAPGTTTNAPGTTTNAPGTTTNASGTTTMTHALTTPPPAPPGAARTTAASAMPAEPAARPGADRATTTGAPSGPPLSAWEKRVNDQFFALAIPLMAGVVGVFAVVVAALIGLFLRLRRQVVLDVGCPSCPMRFPFVVGESPQLFCPACGAPCRVDVTGAAGHAVAHAVPL